MTWTYYRKFGPLIYCSIQCALIYTFSYKSFTNGIQLLLRMPTIFSAVHNLAYSSLCKVPELYLLVVLLVGPFERDLVLGHLCEILLGLLRRTRTQTYSTIQRIFLNVRRR